MAVTDYNKKKPLEVTSQNDSGTTQDKAQPITVRSNLIDNFEDGDVNEWQVLGGTFTAQSTTVISGSFTGELTATNELGDVERSIEGFTNNIEFVVSADNQTSNTSDEFEVDILSNGTTIITITFDDDGNIYTSGGTFTGSTWTAGTNYTVEISPDYTNNEYELFIDGSSQGIFNFESSASSPTTFKVQNETSNSGETRNVFVDDINFSDLNDSETGTGYIILDFTNIAGPEDIAIYDQNDNLLDYEIEELDTTAETAVLWCYNSWVRDGTTQAQIVYGGSTTAREDNTEGTWNNTGQNAVMVQHFQDDPITVTDSTANNNDGTTINGVTAVDGSLDGAANFDGTDDYIDVADSDSLSDTSNDAVVFFSLVATPEELSSFNAWMGKYDTSANEEREYLLANTKDGGVRLQASEDASGSVTVDYRTSGDMTEGTEYVVHGKIDIGNNNYQVFIDSSEVSGSNNGGDITDMSNTGSPLTFGKLTNRDIQHFDGKLDEARLYFDDPSTAWIQADYDASPKGGQIFFTQQAAETTAVTISAPASQGTSQTPNPTVTAGNVNIQVPESTATGTTPNPTIFSDLFVSIPVSQSNSQSPTPTVVAGNTNVALQESIGTGVTPNPSLFIADLIRAPPSTGTGSTPNPLIKGSVINLAVPASTGTGSTPNPELLFDQVVSAKVSQGIGNTPEPQVTGEAVTITMPVTTADSDTPNPVISIEIVPRDSSTLSSIKRDQSKTLSGDINK